MIESIVSILMGLALLAIGLYCLISISIEKCRANWRGTNIKTGAISNLGFSILFLMGAIVTLFVDTPIESFWIVALTVIAPAGLASWLCFLGYKYDMQQHSSESGHLASGTQLSTKDK